MNWHAVLFDLDGTLLNSAASFVSVIDHMRLQRGMSNIDPTLLSQHISGGSVAMVSKAFDLPARHPDMTALVYEFLQTYEEHCQKDPCLFQDIDNCLTHLEDRQIPWGVVTNKHLRFAQPIIEALEWSGRCQVLVCPDHVKQPKPNPEPVSLACEVLHVDPKNVLYIGDDKRDIESGKQAGTRTGAALWGFIHPEDDPFQWGADFHWISPVKMLENWKTL